MTDRSAWPLVAKAGTYLVWREAPLLFHVTNGQAGPVLATRADVNQAFDQANRWNVELNRTGVPPEDAATRAAAAPPPAPPPSPSPPPPPPPPSRPAPATPDKPVRPMGDRGQGRKALSPEGTRTMGMRFTPAQLAKLEALGGATWVRRMIDKAKLPA